MRRPQRVEAERAIRALHRLQRRVGIAAVRRRPGAGRRGVAQRHQRLDGRRRRIGARRVAPAPGVAPGAVGILPGAEELLRLPKCGMGRREVAARQQRLDDERGRIHIARRAEAPAAIGKLPVEEEVGRREGDALLDGAQAEDGPRLVEVARRAAAPTHLRRRAVGPRLGVVGRAQFGDQVHPAEGRRVAIGGDDGDGQHPRATGEERPAQIVRVGDRLRGEVVEHRLARRGPQRRGRRARRRQPDHALDRREGIRRAGEAGQRAVVQLLRPQVGDRLRDRLRVLRRVGRGDRRLRHGGRGESPPERQQGDRPGQRHQPSRHSLLLHRNSFRKGLREDGKRTERRKNPLRDTGEGQLQSMTPVIVPPPFLEG